MPVLERNDGAMAARAILAKSNAAETEIVIDSVQDRFVRYAARGATQSADRERVEVSVRVRLAAPAGASGLREARASCGSLEPASIKSALARALELAQHSPPNARLAPMGSAVAIPISMRDKPTLEHGFEAKARWIRMALERCEQAGLEAGGLAQTTGISRLVMNSAGREVHGYSSRASFSLTASGASGEGWAEAIARTVGAIKADQVVARAVDKAQRSQDPLELAPGEYTVVLEPAAVGALLLFTAYQGFGAREVEEEASFLCGRLGQRVFSECVRLRDDSRHPLHAQLPFDGEGTARAPLTLIEAGAPTRPVTDRNWAARRGEESTGHALQQPSASGPRPQSLVLDPGQQSLEQLVAGVERGLLVTQLHYVNLIDPRELVLTGMTRYGTFLIENGRVGRAVRNLRFTDSLVRLLGQVRAVGSEQQLCGALFDGEIVSAPLLVDGMRFTSTTAF